MNKGTTQNIDKVQPKVVHAIQCKNCLKVLGISWEEIKCHTLCMECGKGI